MYRLRVYRMNGETVLAACDEALVGTTLSHGKVNVPVSEAFYGKERVDEERLRVALEDCTVANLMGKACVHLAVEMGLVRKDRILLLGDVPHAQLARIPSGPRPGGPVPGHDAMRTGGA